MKPLVVDSQQHEFTPLLMNSLEGEARYELMAEIALAWMDSVGVDLTVLIAMDPAFGEWACRHVPDRFRAVNIMYGSDVALLDAALAQPGVVGVRLILALHPDDAPDVPAVPEEFARLTREDYGPMLSKCEKLGVPVFVVATDHVNPAAAMARVAAVAEAHPDLAIVVDHFGLQQPPIIALPASPWAGLEHLLGLSKYPNIFLKACGAPSLSHEPFPFKDVWPYLHQLINAFGADRLMWASDISRVHGRIGWEAMPYSLNGQDDYLGKHTYNESLALFRDTNEISSAEKELILGGTARRVLHLDG